MTERNVFRGVNSIKFNQRFKDDNDCLEYLADIKWLNGYKCKRCNNDKFGNGTTSTIDVVQSVGIMKAQQLEHYLKN
jgi:hypothetical protein